MACQSTVYQWEQEILRRFTGLSCAQALGLALWSVGTVIGRGCSLSLVSLVLSQALERRQNSVRQQLREWYFPAQHKRGREKGRAKQGHGRHELDQATLEGCFGPLLRWVLELGQGQGQGQGQKQLALALDATSLQDRFVVLCISVLYRGCAIPVAWAVLRAGEKQAWRDHWLRLLSRLEGAVPSHYCVLVMADRGLSARWLFEGIVALGWHPLLRINGGGTFRAQGQAHYEALSVQVRRLEGWGSVAGVAFQGPCALPCTLSVFWDKGCREPWLVLSDLEPRAVQACWYGLRAWIEHGFKHTKREGWQWQRTRMEDPQRVARIWLVLSVATLWALLQGTVAEEDDPEVRPDSDAPRTVSLFRRGWVAQIVALWKGLQLQWTPALIHSPWPAAPKQCDFYDSS